MMNPYTAAPFSYLELPTVSPLAITELMPGARNLIHYVQVAPGERVLLLVEHTVDPVVIQAIAAAVSYRDADVHVLSVTPFSPGGSDKEVPTAIAAAAHDDADVVIGGTWWGAVHTAPLFFAEVARRSARVVSLTMAATAISLYTGARFPNEIHYAIVRRALSRLSSVRELRVTSPRGTDLTFYDPTFSPDDGPVTSGVWRPFPYGGANFYPASTSGVLVIEDSTATGVPEEPLRVELADNVVTSIEGGIAAKELRRFSPGGYYMRHGLLGLNPKVRLLGGTQFEREKHAGAFYCGLDALTDGVADLSRPGFAHCDCQVDRPTVTVDGEIFVDGGRLLLLDDPEIIEVAAAFGPPDILLDDNPTMVLPRRYTGGTSAR